MSTPLRTVGVGDGMTKKACGVGVGTAVLAPMALTDTSTLLPPGPST
jgi:hypothetical protein